MSYLLCTYKHLSCFSLPPLSFLSPLPFFLSLSSLPQADPLLRPVNLLEKRDLLPSSCLTPPETVLPGNLGQFNPSPAVFCSTMNAVPATSSLLNKLKLPFAVHIHPYKEMHQSVSNVMG